MQRWLRPARVFFLLALLGLASPPVGVARRGCGDVYYDTYDPSVFDCVGARSNGIGAIALGWLSLTTASAASREPIAGCRRLAVPTGLEWVHAGVTTRGGEVLLGDVGTARIWRWQRGGWSHSARRGGAGTRRGDGGEAPRPAAGQVEVEWPAGQAHLVLVDHRGFAPWWGQPATSQAPLALAPGSRLQGRVVGLAEGAVGEACARWRVPLEGWRRARTYRRCAPLAPDGAFQISGLGEHSVDLTVVAPGWLPAERTATPGRELPPIQLIPGFAVTGRVVDPLRRPVAGARLRSRGVEIAATGTEGEFRAAVVTEEDGSDSDGTFEVRGALPGDYEVRSRSAGRPLRSPEVTIAGDQVIDLPDWQLDRGCRLRGQILSRAGGPSGPGLKLALLAPGGSRLEPLAETRADESGRFDLGLVVPEVYLVEARSGAR